MQFCRPGRNIVIKTTDSKAGLVFWRGIADHEYKDCWENTLFHNESSVLSSVLLKESVSYLFHFVIKGGDLPKDGIISYVQKAKVRSSNPGFCYMKAGFDLIKESEKFRIFQIKQVPEEVVEIRSSQLNLF